MNVMLQRHCAKYIYVIPDGLRELMTDISREVLRCQPLDIYTFIADYLDALIITRENARVAARVVESLIEVTITTAALLESTGSTRDEVDRIVSIIRRSFNKSIEEPPEKIQSTSDEVIEANIVSDILNEADVSPSQAEMAASIIQNAYRSFKQRKARERELLKDMIDWRLAARSAIYLYRKTGVTNEEAHKAATLIKAAYKGYYTRRFMIQLQREEEEKLQQQARDKESVRSEDKGDSQHKAVRINYQTVIPHVDFDESERLIAEHLTDEFGYSEDKILTKEDSKIIEEKLQKEMGLSICKSVVSDIVTNAVQYIMFNLEAPGETMDDEGIINPIVERSNEITAENLDPNESAEKNQVDSNEQKVVENSEPEQPEIQN